MHGRIKRETVIACEDKIFRIDDIVTVKTYYSNEKYSGRIIMIGDGAFMIDTSEKYRSTDMTMKNLAQSNVSRVWNSRMKRLWQC